MHPLVALNAYRANKNFCFDRVSGRGVEERVMNQRINEDALFFFFPWRT